ncbi:Hypothetical protein AA314_07173 [Archangium gephyra]|uniref:Uncharacterized protein n=1 Tax=Archangium gephyra TaxID=48 RepID=A0AAC8TGS9_9BACT|nr:Hypothetical protein AA314_07173 [Archangium gephyra]
MTPGRGRGGRALCHAKVSSRVGRKRKKAPGCTRSPPYP